MLLISLAILVSGCTTSNNTGTTPGNNTGTAPATNGSANYQRCASQCGPENAGNGSFCQDGCRVQEAEDTKSTALCDQLNNQENRPSCYGIVAKAVGDLTVCNRLPEGTERNYCVSIFGS